MRRYITLDRMYQLLAEGLPLGLRRKGQLAHSWEWDVSGDCREPPDVRLIARTEYKGRPVPRVHPVEAKTILLDMQVPCRKCDRCKARKSAHWRFRAEDEVRAAPRTWLGTLTLSVESHYQMKLRAADNLGFKRKPKGAVTTLRFEDLDTEEQFKLRCSEIGKELTLYLKRVRKATEGKLRFLVVYERHDGKRSKGTPKGAVYGLPHLHLLVHECDPLAPVRKKTLQAKWALGFSSFKLVDKEDPRSGSYVCKYIAKDCLTRVRSSQHYGSENTNLLARNFLEEKFP